MGSWGTGIYSNDIAQDLRDDLKEIYGYYENPEDGDKRIFVIYKSIIEQEWIDDDYASFWYALADWQWKHGLLTEEVKSKTLELLEAYAGIEEWEADTSKRDVEKRKAVLDSLRERLNSEQPPRKRPKFRVVKPKHKAGDIIIFKAVSGDNIFPPDWKINGFRVPFIFKEKDVASLRYSEDIGYDAVGKYMAVLCIGTTKEPYSQNLPDVINEHSLYVWYDYMSNIKPTVETLKNCGFLPMVDWWFKDWNRNITGILHWIYKFKLDGEKFAQNPLVSELQKLRCSDELERFEYLFSKKQRANDYKMGWSWGLEHIFEQVFAEKNRFDLLGIKLDNLLDSCIDNPDFRSFDEVDADLQEFFYAPVAETKGFFYDG